VHVKKIRFKHVGQKGKCDLHYDKNTGRYSVPTKDTDDYPTGDQPDMYTYEA
jgi:hypothetical protein